jgi:Caulimovirus viroplasmin
MSARFRTNGKKRQAPAVEKAECFAVAAGHKLGIFFSRDEMFRAVLGFPKRHVRSFLSVNEAQAFLREQGLVPTISSNGWTSTKKAPILYQRLLATTATATPPPKPGGSSPSSGASAASSSGAASAFASIDRTPHTAQSDRSVITIHSSPEEIQKTPAKPSSSSASGCSNPYKKRKVARGDVIDIQSDDDDDQIEEEEEEGSKPSPSKLDVDLDQVQQHAIDSGEKLGAFCIFFHCSRCANHTHS